MLVSPPNAEVCLDSTPLLLGFNPRQRAEDAYRKKLALLLSVYSTLILIWLPMPQVTKEWSQEPPPIANPIPRIKPKPLETIKTKLKPTKAMRVPIPGAAPPAPEIPWRSNLSELTEPVEWDTDYDLSLPNMPAPLMAARPMEIDAEGLNRPIFLKKVEPDYPVLAQRMKRNGQVDVEAILHADGTIGDIQILAVRGGSQFGFGKAALNAVRQWRFLPATYRGKKVDVRLSVTIYFSLE